MPDVEWNLAAGSGNCYANSLTYTFEDNSSTSLFSQLTTQLYESNKKIQIPSFNNPVNVGSYDVKVIGTIDVNGTPM